MNPQFPVYIVSKGRAETCPTARYLHEMGVPFRIIVEEFERDLYAKQWGSDRILVLPDRYQADYDTCDDLGDTRSKGPGPARNFAWKHSIESGSSHHWVMDDNIYGFYRLNRNLKVPVSDGTIFKAMEDFVLRYVNIAMSGPAYFKFISRKDKQPAFVVNTRIYSCNLIRNDISFRWRGRYNEDTDLSLRILKAGLCTIQFKAFLQDKLTTQRLKGGNNGDFYEKDGTGPKSEMLVRLHPDVSRLAWRFGRYHHYVDYSPFGSIRPVLRKDVELAPGVNNYGMKLKRVEVKKRGKRKL